MQRWPQRYSGEYCAGDWTSGDAVPMVAAGIGISILPALALPLPEVAHWW